MKPDQQKILMLRNLTNAGIVPCRNALSEAAGDVEAAVQILRTRGEIDPESESSLRQAETQRLRREMNQVILRSILQFLAMESKEQLTYLPPSWPSIDYLLDHSGDRTDNPLYYFTFKVWEFLEIPFAGDDGDDDFFRVLADIRTILTVMLDGRYGYIWTLGGPLEKPVSGPADGLWNVLRRLAREALALKGWTATKPDLPFDRAVQVEKLGPSTRGKEKQQQWQRRP